ncbi:MAG: transcription-repair coupling factor [Desulfobulbaceae bacterium]|jgi:transcription-repair coupling factor (superfamily II helicase)|nr:transcription-repair coupling factor [Desulfobulbaceae bacterium]
MQSIIKRLQDGGPEIDICGVRGGSPALLLAEMAGVLRRPVCCIVASDELMETLGRDIPLFTAIPVLVYPSFEIPPYTPLSPDPATVAQRLATLYRLLNTSGPCIVLSSAEAVLRKIMPKNLLGSHCELVMTGEETDRDRLLAFLTEGGYQQCSMVQHEGDFSVRGGVVDIFAPPADRPVYGPLRLDFFGDTIESIRVFDPVTQRSIAELDEAVLLPASDILFPAPEKNVPWEQFLQACPEEFDWDREAADPVIAGLIDHIRFTGIEFYLPLVYEAFDPLQTLFDYLPDRTIRVFHEPAEVRARINLVRERIEANYEEGRRKNQAVVPPARLFIDEAGLRGPSGGQYPVNLCTLPDPHSPNGKLFLNVGDHGLLAQEIELHRKMRGNLAPLADRLGTWIRREETTVIACRSARQSAHLREMLGGYRLPTAELNAPLHRDRLPRGERVFLVEHPLSRGFDLPDEGFHLLSATELFGDRRLRPEGRKKTETAGEEPLAVEELATGDLVVHRDHGIGIFQGLLNMEFAGQRGDFMQIEYRDGDKLYVPVDRLHWVSRYQGLPEQIPKLDQLGSNRWQSTKNKVKEAVWQVAQELLEIYARRAVRQGHSFSRPGELYQELEQSFPYDETTGQLTAIEAVMEDMTGERPMDRLICGDVGYGKTEVAARAAFKAVEDGYQVAVLVPTTVLAEQHAATFRERFASFPVTIACINRFRSPQRQKEIVRDLAAGRIDLLIGTHRLLSKDIAFNRLGLLIVDEEHRFGVSHKEKIKKLRAEVDVLTLTATPIPRTLQMSLLGIRDLSVISTPPRKRRSIKTFLARNDDLVIREAIMREMQRGGQVFFVHNRVRSIGRIARKIEQLVPQARLAVAHGQLPGRVLEEIMVKFINHEVDVLVCTTIIESGLDIPNANTIIINRADQLGLAEIYQLRGRVGRSSRQSYAYLLVPSLETLTRDARQRLQALMDCSELGSGFKLAMNDLQIRGGGNLLGVSQSGHIAAVGYDLYLELLQATVAEMKNGRTPAESGAAPDIDPEIKLKVSAYLPENYIEDPAQRYHFYRRISAAGSATPEQLAELREELRDRFGTLPPEAETLFDVIGLKYRLRRLGIARLEQGPDALVFSFIREAPVNPRTIVEMISRKTGKKERPVRLTPDNRLIIPLDMEASLFAFITAALERLEQTP